MIPLAHQIRPESFQDLLGNHEVFGDLDVFLDRVKGGNIQSMILHGPPGCGKTTIAKLICQFSDLPSVESSAVNIGVKDVRSIIQTAQQAGKLILFLDEIHRFNKSQQDALLHAIEEGIIILIGATTENPSFEVNRAILSRCQLIQFDALSNKAIEEIIQKGFLQQSIEPNLFQPVLSDLSRIAIGDARRALNIVETLVLRKELWENEGLTSHLISQLLGKPVPQYDKDGDNHYDMISAMIKSLRASKEQQALYWMHRMLEAGEDPKFIARRLLIFASEDIGLANPSAMGIANACFEAVHKLGMPEAKYSLTQMGMYLARSKKSREVVEKIKATSQILQEYPNLSVPKELRSK